MDKIIKNAAVLVIIIFVLFVSIASYNAFVEKAYRESLKSSYSYSCTISTDSVLTNVTLFIPVP
jgi:YbbR domain-containing protein